MVVAATTEADVICTTPDASTAPLNILPACVTAAVNVMDAVAVISVAAVTVNVVIAPCAKSSAFDHRKSYFGQSH
jgi:hypothetical protein